MSGPFLFLTPFGLSGRSILVNFSYVLRAEPSSDGKSTLLTLIRDSDPDGLKTVRVEEHIQWIASRLQSGSMVAGNPPSESPAEVYGVSFPPPKSSAVETIMHGE